MGGMHGFGAVDASDRDAYHADWEKRVLPLRLAVILAGHGHGDLRPHIEALSADDYLSRSYYERWVLAFQSSLVQADLLSEGDVASRASAIRAGEAAPPKRAEPSPEIGDRVAAVVASVTKHGVAAAGRFRPSDVVHVRRMSPAGHTRCPRYIRGVKGIVESVTGGFPRPDPGDHPVEQTYTVRFDFRDIWGEDTEKGVLYLDLWEGYLA
jgi:nitrile hydratase subunit beta